MEEKIKTVAVFMGLFQDKRGFWGFENTPERQRCHSDRIKDIYQYDRDWNLLMKVVEKIESLNYKLFIETFEIRIENFGVVLFKQHISVSKQSKIEAVYNTCIEFINFYNKQEEK